MIAPCRGAGTNNATAWQGELIVVKSQLPGREWRSAALLQPNSRLTRNCTASYASGVDVLEHLRIPSLLVLRRGSSALNARV